MIHWCIRSHLFKTNIQIEFSLYYNKNKTFSALTVNPTKNKEMTTLDQSPLQYHRKMELFPLKLLLTVVTF